MIQFIWNLVEDALRKVETLNGEAINVYIGIAARAAIDGDGTKNNLSHAMALWIDADFEDDQDRIELKRKLDAFPLPPSFKILSGNGGHLLAARRPV